MSLKHILLATVFILSGTFVFAQPRIGYVNSALAYTSHPSYSMAMSDVEKYENELAEQLKKLQQEIQTESEIMEDMRINGDSEVTIREQQNKVLSMQQNFDEVLEESKEQLKEYKNKLIQPLIKETDAAIIKNAETHKLDVIFQDSNNEGVSMVLYAPENAALNADLLTELKSNRDISDIEPYSFKEKKVRIGYTNLEMVLSATEEFKSIDVLMDQYREKLMIEYETKQKEGESVLESYNAEQDGGKKEAYMDELNKIYAELETMQLEYEEKLDNKKAELLEPILEKIEAAIHKVAKKNKLTFVLNQTTSTGISTIVLGPENTDITSALYDELGIEYSSTEAIKLDPKINPKLGYINVELIMGSMPEVATVSEKLDAYQTNLVESAQRKGKDPYKDQEAADEITLKVNQYRTQLLNPILNKIQAAIDELAVEENCDYIINQTGGNILYASTSFDLNDKLAKKLGLL